MNPYKAARLWAGFESRGDAAKHLGLERGQLGRYERNVHKPGPEILVRMAQGYGLTVDQVMGLAPLPPKQRSHQLA